MDAPEIRSPAEKSQRLNGTPIDWTMIVLSRLALRVLPTMADTEPSWMKFHTLSIFRANLVAWASINDQAFEFKTATKTSLEALQEAHRLAYDDNMSWPSIASATNAVCSLNGRGFSEILDWNDGHVVGQYEHVDKMVFDASSVESDFSWLLGHQHMHNTAEMTGMALWLNKMPVEWDMTSLTFERKLISIAPSYQVWIDWYERRIRGERAAFDIPGDKNRVEDKKILRRLAEATDEDFWGKGHEYVNATLKSWLDEARARVAQPPHAPEEKIQLSIEDVYDFDSLPPQNSDAITYGVNADGKLHRLPHGVHSKLYDTPDQRRVYADIRQAARELFEEGERLGPRLVRGIDIFVRSLPERFEDAETYPIWRNANALRRLYRAHWIAENGPEWDGVRLEPAIAEALDVLLMHYSVFASDDPRLRALEEEALAPPESPNSDAAPVFLPTQNRNALSFQADSEGRVAIDTNALADKLRRDAGAQVRYAESVEMARRWLALCEASNAAARLTKHLKDYLAATGNTIEDAEPSLIVLRGERLRQELAAYQKTDSTLPPVADDVLLEGQSWQSAHNLMVALDPVLNANDTAILGRIGSQLPFCLRSCAKKPARPITPKFWQTASSRLSRKLPTSYRPFLMPRTGAQSRLAKWAETFLSKSLR